MYELYDPCTVMFFFRNKHIQIDLGTGNNNKVNWAMDDKQEFIDIVEVVYTGARKGRGGRKFKSADPWSLRKGYPACQLTTANL